MVNKQEFFNYMSILYEEDYNDVDVYRTMKKILKIKDIDHIKDLQNLIDMDKPTRLKYRMTLANNGKELTPRQLDQYLSMIEYALRNMDE